jgi:hypothetical protein
MSNLQAPRIYLAGSSPATPITCRQRQFGLPTSVNPRFPLTSPNSNVQAPRIYLAGSSPATPMTCRQRQFCLPTSVAPRFPISSKLSGPHLIYLGCGSGTTAIPSPGLLWDTTWVSRTLTSVQDNVRQPAMFLQIMHSHRLSLQPPIIQSSILCRPRPRQRRRARLLKQPFARGPPMIRFRRRRPLRYVSTGVTRTTLGSLTKCRSLLLRYVVSRISTNDSL